MTGRSLCVILSRLLCNTLNVSDHINFYLSVLSGQRLQLGKFPSRKMKQKSLENVGTIVCGS